jgi:hypothetical protein
MAAVVGNEVMRSVNVSEIKDMVLSNPPNLKDLPPELTGNIGTLITILKTIGIVFLIYLIFLIISSIMAIIRNRRIKKIYEKVNEIDGKLDVLLKKNKKDKKSK